MLAIKMGTGELNQGDVEIARRCLRVDLSQQRVTVGPPIWGRHYQEARALLVRYGVVAVALDLRQFGLIGVMLAADHRLCRAAQLSGCPAVNPEKPGALLA